MTPSTPDRTITELDHVRLTHLLARSGATTHPLLAVLDAADTVPSRAVPADVVTMNSRVELREPRGGRVSAISLRYPDGADAASGAVSVLSPLGTQLIGLRAGDTVEWRTPDGRTQAAELVSVVFQPEAEGEYLA